MLSFLESPSRHLFFTGKGGVGKTSLACVSAVRLADAGREVLLVSTDPASNLKEVLGAPVDDTVGSVDSVPHLSAVNIDPEAAADDYRERVIEPMVGVLPDETVEQVEEQLSGACTTEIASFDKFTQFLAGDEGSPYDHVVFDTAPTGHTLRLLELPEAMDSMLGKLLTFKERMSGMLDGLGGMFGDDASQEDMERDLQAMREQIEQLRAVLRDPDKTDFRVVMVPEELSVMESERLLDRLEAFGIPAGTIVVNRVLQDLDSVVDVDLPGDYVGPNHEDCEFCARRWSVQQDALARSQDLFRGHEVRRVPLLAEEVQGEELLEVVAACLD